MFMETAQLCVGYVQGVNRDRNREWRELCRAGGCQVLVSPCWAPELGPVLVLLSQKCFWKPQGALAVCLSCSRPQSQQNQGCFHVVGVPAACFGPGVLSEQWNSSLLPPRTVCDCPLAAFPGFRNDILLSCQSVVAFAAAELRFWGHLVSLGDGPEHFGLFYTF